MNLSKLFTFLILTGAVISFTPQTAAAQANGDGGNFGVGAMLGEPTGVSIKSWNNNRSAFALGAAWSLSRANEAVHLHADYLLHTWFNGVERGELAFYYGLGARIIFSDNAQAGVRIPFGLNYVFDEAPLDLFVEAVPILNLTPDTDFAGNGALGIRYYF
ncbi:MAG: hypothetical protein WD016_13400 [Balneolaceae bacterium]